jgi:phage tail tape-measure protein
MDETPSLPEANPNANRDPITGPPGAHPVGTGVGAFVGGAAAGAASGAVGGPVGAVVGAVMGAVLGGLAGKQVAEGMDPTMEDAHWREHFASRRGTSGLAWDQAKPATRDAWQRASDAAARVREPDQT